MKTYFIIFDLIFFDKKIEEKIKKIKKLDIIKFKGYLININNLKEGDLFN